MTAITTPSREQLTADIERISFELDQAKTDVATLQRLKNAEADEKRLGLQLRAAQEQLAEVTAAEVIERQEAQFARFKDIRVREVIDPASNSVLRNVYSVTLIVPEWNGYEAYEKPLTFDLKALPADALQFLVSKHPERIPTGIMALCPGNPWEAINEYFMAVRRGYVSTSAAE